MFRCDLDVSVPFNRSQVIAITTSSINLHVYIKILDDFLIPLIENLFYIEVISENDNATYPRAKRIEAFFRGKAYKINDMASPVLNAIYGRFRNELVYKKVPSITTISERWSRLVKEYGLKLVESLAVKRVKIVIKTRREGN